MNKQECSSVGFGFWLILIWLVGLTAFVMYGKIVESRGIAQTIVLPPPLEVIEIEGVDYDLQSDL